MAYPSAIKQAKNTLSTPTDPTVPTSLAVMQDYIKDSNPGIQREEIWEQLTPTLSESTKIWD